MAYVVTLLIIVTKNMLPLPRNFSPSPCPPSPPSLPRDGRDAGIECEGDTDYNYKHHRRDEATSLGICDVLTLPRGVVRLPFSSLAVPFPPRPQRDERTGTTTTYGMRKAIRLTSSNLAHMSLKAVKMESVLPVTVTILSGHEPSLMLIFAPD